MELKILSYNIHKGRAFFSRQRIWYALDKLFHKVQPDIIFLQEFLEEPQAEALLEKLADKLWPHYSFGRNATTGNYHYGNAILSKFPFEESFNTDISTNPFERRGLLYGRIRTPSKKRIHLYCSHLDLRKQGRQKQIAKIKNVLHSQVEDHDPFILGGDFNDWTQRLHSEIGLSLNAKEVFTSLGQELPLTCPSIYPAFSLDRIYYRGFSPLAGRVLSTKTLRLLSDHLPLTAVLKF